MRPGIRLPHRLPVWIPISLFALAATVCGQTPERRVFAVDPVELIKAGQEVKGEAQWSVAHAGFTYRFASAGNKAEFERQPARFEIQMGGACGRMGPLSGEGRCDLFAVHEGKLYIFASPQCRAAFLKNPEKLIEVDDPPVWGDEAARQRGRELVELAVKAHGGAEAIDAAKSYRQTTEATSTDSGKEYRNQDTFAIAFPDRIRDESCWNESCAVFVVVGSRGACLTEKGFDRPMAESQVRALQRGANVNLLAILKARRNRDFVAAAVDSASLEGAKIERVAVSFDGMRRVLGIDPATGRVRTLEYRGRGGESNVLGAIVRTYRDYEPTGGITLPVSWTSSFDGGPPNAKPARLGKVEVNVPLDEKLFAADSRTLQQ